MYCNERLLVKMIFDLISFIIKAIVCAINRSCCYLRLYFVWGVIIIIRLDGRELCDATVTISRLFIRVDRFCSVNITRLVIPGSVIIISPSTSSRSSNSIRLISFKVSTATSPFYLSSSAPIEFIPPRRAHRTAWIGCMVINRRHVFEVFLPRRILIYQSIPLTLCFTICLTIQSWIMIIPSSTSRPIISIFPSKINYPIIFPSRINYSTIMIFPSIIMIYGRWVFPSRIIYPIIIIFPCRISCPINTIFPSRINYPIVFPSSISYSIIMIFPSRISCLLNWIAPSRINCSI